MTDYNYNPEEDAIPSIPGEPDDTDHRVELYNLYGDHVFEDLESFCDRMADRYGENWIHTLRSR